MVEASSDNVEAHFNGHETAGRRCLVLLKDKIYLAALDLAQGLYHGRFAGELLGRYAPGARRGSRLSRSRERCQRHHLYRQ